MIKKLIGILFALATLATIVFAVMGSGRYRSLVWPDGFEWSHLMRRDARPDAASEPVQETVPARNEAPARADRSQSQTEDVQADYFEDAEDDLPSDLFMESDY